MFLTTERATVCACYDVLALDRDAAVVAVLGLIVLVQGRHNLLRVGLSLERSHIDRSFVKFVLRSFDACFHEVWIVSTFVAVHVRVLLCVHSVRAPHLRCSNWTHPLLYG